jgi:hypothetical protein
LAIIEWIGEIDLKYLNGCLLVLALTSQMAVAEELRFLTEEEMQGAVASRTARGVIYSVDLAERTAIISGYKYYFGSPNEQADVKVKMYNSAYGAFELLQPGMKVEIVYGDDGNERWATEVQQLSDIDVPADSS